MAFGEKIFQMIVAPQLPTMFGTLLVDATRFDNQDGKIERSLDSAIIKTKLMKLKMKKVTGTHYIKKEIRDILDDESSTCWNVKITWKGFKTEV